MPGRWFHAHLSGDAAENILKRNGVEGTFLVRPSEHTPGHFTVSVLHYGDVTHIKITNNGDFFVLSGGPDQFATLNDLVIYYMENPGSIRLKDGEVISLRQPLISEDPTSERWFHGALRGKDAEALLVRKGRSGNFLVRESQSQPSQYVLTVLGKSAISHVIIRNKEGKYDVGSGPQFDSLLGLIDYYRVNQHLKDAKDHTLIVLQEPFHSTSFVASAINERIKQLSKKGKSGSTGFREEFEKLREYDATECVYTTIEGQKIENKRKNRYKNILPYDHSRVVLKNRSGKGGYINANFINGELRHCEIKYIACQGPLPGTSEDFWHMCYQEKVKVITMLARPVENEKKKCHKYWPEPGHTEEYGDFVVTTLLQSETKEVVNTELRLYHKETDQEPPRLIFLYQYVNWPDHGVPNDTSTFLGLLNEMHSRNATEAVRAPIVVHCSAGIGRTGTAIAVAVLMHVIEEQGLDDEIDVLKTTQLLRSQRSGMIQTELQYRFVYMALSSFIEAEKTRRNVRAGQNSTLPYSNLTIGNEAPCLQRSSEAVLSQVMRERTPDKSTDRHVKETVPKQSKSPKRTRAVHLRKKT